MTDSAPSLDSRRPKRTGKRAIRRLALYAVASLAILGFAGSFHDVESDHFREVAKNFLEGMYDREIEVGKASFNFLGRVTLRDVKVHNPGGYASPYLLVAPEIHFHLGMTGGDTTAFRPRRIHLDDAEFWFERPRDGKWNTENLWVEKAEKPALPTFHLPIKVTDARIHFTDGNVGESGIALVFDPVDVDYTVMSDGREIRTLLTARNVALPVQGKFSLAMEVEPARRHAVVNVTLEDAAPEPLEPYYHFLTMLRFEGGSADVRQRMEFHGSRIALSGSARIREASIHHIPSGVVLNGIEPGVDYQTVYDDTAIRLDTITVQWGNSLIRADGILPRRNADSGATEIRFRTSDGFGEDLSFLLSDPRFSAKGKFSGECVLTGRGPITSENPVTYAVGIDLHGADVHYGRVITKPAGIAGRLGLRGAGGRRPDEVRIELAGSEATLNPIEGGWRLVSRALDAAGLPEYLAPLEPLRGAEAQTRRISGMVAADIAIGGDGIWDGTLDLTGAALDFDPWLVKPSGTLATITLRSRMEHDIFRIERSFIRLGGSSFSLAGTWKKGAADLDLDLHRVKWDDIRAFSPHLRWKETEKSRLKGTVSGRLALAVTGNAPDTHLRVDADLDLINTSIAVDGIGEKTAGVAAAVGITGDLRGESLRVEKGYVRFLDSKLGFTGHFTDAGFDLEGRGAQTGLGGIRALLAERLWTDLSDVEIDGPGDVVLVARARGDEMDLSAELDARPAFIELPGRWQKPTGEIFLLRGEISKKENAVRFDRLQMTQGTSVLLYEGGAGKGAVHGTLRADLDVPHFIERTPGIASLKTGDYTAEEVLKMIADSKGRAELIWKVHGSLADPRLELDKDRIKAQVIGKHLSGFASLFLSPLTFGTKMAGELFD